MHPAVRRLGGYLTRHVDGLLLGLVLALMALGLMVLFSASNANLARVTAQLANMLIALGVMWAFANIPPHYLLRLAFPLYILGVLLLVAVALLGDVVHGARRWLDMGITRIQPSELMKIAVPLALAWYFDRYEATLRLGNYVVAVVMLVIPVALIVRQPDLGTALLITAGGLLRAVPRGAFLAHHHGTGGHRCRRPPVRVVGAARLPAPAHTHPDRPNAGPPRRSEERRVGKECRL